MKSGESTIPGLPPPSTSSAHPIFRPRRIRYSVEQVSKLKRCSDVIESHPPNDKKSNISVRKMLWKSSTQKLKATFLNGKRLTIRYVFDCTRQDRENILIKRDCLSPIFGGVVPATLDRFSSISEICSLVITTVHLDECEDGRQAYCPCHPLHDNGEFYGIVKPAVDKCSNRHFHHYCSEHVVSWMYNYLNLVILLRESKELFNQEIAEIYSFFPNDIFYFQTGNRTTTEFLLKTALEVDAAIYESDGQ